MPDHCEVQPTPMKAPAGTAASATARREAADDGRPPLGRVLLGPTTAKQMEGHRLGGVGHDPAAGGHHRHLGATGAEVDGQDVLPGRRWRPGHQALRPAHRPLTP